MEKQHKTRSEEQKSDEHRERIKRLLSFKEKSGIGVEPPVRIVQDALLKEYPDLPIEESKRVARDIMLAPKGKLISVGDKKEPITVEDLQFRIAHVIELVNSETDSMQQYYRWIDKGDDALRELNDGHVSESDLKLREEFLAPLDQREAELIMCINLYSKSEHSLAQDRVKELSNKLAKLREYRSKVSATKDKADISPQEKEKEKERSAAEELARIRAANAMRETTRKRLEILSGRRSNNEHVGGDYLHRRRSRISSYLFSNQNQNELFK